MVGAPFLFLRDGVPDKTQETAAARAHSQEPLDLRCKGLAAVVVAEILAALERFAALVRPTMGLRAAGTKTLHGTAIALLRVRDAAIAIVAVVGLRGWSAGGEKKAESRGSESRFSENRAEVEREKFHMSLQELGPGWSSGMLPQEFKHLFGGKVAPAQTWDWTNKKRRLKSGAVFILGFIGKSGKENPQGEHSALDLRYRAQWWS